MDWKKKAANDGNAQVRLKGKVFHLVVGLFVVVLVCGVCCATNKKLTPTKPPLNTCRTSRGDEEADKI